MAYKNKFGFLLSIVIVILLLVGGVSYYYKNNKAIIIAPTGNYATPSFRSSGMDMRDSISVSS